MGRSADADVPLDDPDVSRLHCAVTVEPDGSVYIADLRSTNGTIVDGTELGDLAVPLPPGALLRIGESALRLQSPPRTPDPALSATPDGEGHLRVASGRIAPERRPAGRPRPAPCTPARPPPPRRPTAPAAGRPVGARRGGHVRRRARPPPGHPLRGVPARPPGIPTARRPAPGIPRTPGIPTRGPGGPAADGLFPPAAPPRPSLSPPPTPPPTGRAQPAPRHPAPRHPARSRPPRAHTGTPRSGTHSGTRGPAGRPRRDDRARARSAVRPRSPAHGRADPRRTTVPGPGRVDGP
ncbi:FHA domain-containing protein [Streptomyces noursei]|nr:FHA domain-containing protein [Streptomyces noursei]